MWLYFQIAVPLSTVPPEAPWIFSFLGHRFPRLLCRPRLSTIPIPLASPGQPQPPRLEATSPSVRALTTRTLGYPQTRPCKSLLPQLACLVSQSRLRPLGRVCVIGVLSRGIGGLFFIGSQCCHHLHTSHSNGAVMSLNKKVAVLRGW